MKSGYRWRVLACAATLLTFGLAATIYSVEELGMDGHLAPAVALLPPSHMLSYLWEDVTPPLYFWALKAWLWAAGVGFIQTRWLSMACASLAEALLFVIGKRLIGSRAGAVTVLLWAACPPVVAEAATSRIYMPGLLTSLLSVCVFLAMLRKPSKMNIGLTALVNAIAIATWYQHGIFLILEAALGAMRRGRRGVAVLALATGVALTTPLIVLAAPSVLGRAADPQLYRGATERHWPTIPVFGREIVQFTLGDLPLHLPDTSVLALGGLWLLIAGIGAVLLVRGAGRSGASALIVGAFAGMLAFVVMTATWATDAARYLLPGLPFVFLLQGAALASGTRLVWRGLAACWLVAVLGFGVAEFWRVHSLPPIQWDQDPVLQYVTATAAPGDVVLLSDWAAQGRYDLLYARQHPLNVYAIQTFNAQEAAAVPGQLAPMFKQLSPSGRFWFVDSDLGNPAFVNTVENTLEANFYFVQQKAIPSPIFAETVLVREYAPAPAPQAHGSDAVLGGKVALATVGLGSTTKAGHVVPIDLTWKSLGTLPDNYSVFVHVVDANGHMVAQQDGWPDAGLRPTSGWQPGDTIDDRRAVELPPGVPPGQYKLLAGMYMGDTRLKLADGSDTLTLGSVTVTAGS